jgi:pseudouridylate synthase
MAQAPNVQLSDEVAAALAANQPVVALESTIITHGMPYPTNVETARLVEEEVRAAGAIPATIAVLGGAIRVGLDAATIEQLGQADDVMKLSRADLAYAVMTGRSGSTTVAATMICAHLAGIAVFATGGIGGVHRGVEDTMDISADLTELARTPVIVVCAGAKAILDLPRTLEVLETQGVPVVGFGTSEFPAFWSRTSGLSLGLRADSGEDVARLAVTMHELGLDAGVLVANPVPVEYEIGVDVVHRWIDQSHAEAVAGGVSGKAVTPFLLGRIAKISDGASLATNVALIRNNARVAAQIAVAHASLLRTAS